MRKRWPFLIFALLFFCSSLAHAQSATLGSERIFSPSVAQKFYEIAYELTNPAHGAATSQSDNNVEGAEDVNEMHIQQAVIFLNAALGLDSRASYVHPALFRVVAHHPGKYDYSGLVYNSLEKYLDKSADFEPARQAVQYMLERLDFREQREQLLTFLLQNLGGRNACFDSEVSTLLGLLMAEKADANATQYYFIRAFNSNKYNKLAFDKLAEFVPEDRIAPTIYLEHFRLMLGKNPLDLEAALAFARYAEKMQLYETAADAYQYCALLFGFLYPSQELPPDIYLPMMLSNYNTPRNQNKCLQIASRLRGNGRFDLFTEAIAGKAAIKIGHAEQANRIFQTIEEKINSQPETIGKQSIAWFYCFASPDANKALQWANRSFSAEPDSPMAASLLAYSLVMNEQTDWAKLLIEKYERNQISDLTLAQIQLADGQRDLAVGTLKSAITKDPGSLEAEHAKEILSRIGGEYIPAFDPGLILSVLRDTFAQTLVPVFTDPEKIISAQLNFRGIEFHYGSTLDGTVTITNNSYEPLIIADDGLFTGRLRVDANITGDLNKNIPNLAYFRIRPALPVDPGSSFLVPLHLFTGELGQLLLTHPQASVDIEFTLYLDPVTTDQGRIVSRVPGLKPITATIKRPGVEITSSFLQNRLSSLAKGRQGQKIETSQLFVGLLMEQNAMANRKPAYKFTYGDWMPPVLKSALLHNLTYGDWAVKVHTMADMTSLPLDYEFMNALAENLNDTHWPTRMMAMYLLAKDQGGSFTRVLDWAVRYDSNDFVRNMAVALGGTLPAPPPSQERSARSPQASAQQRP